MRKRKLSQNIKATKENHSSQKVRIFPVFPPVLFYLLVKGTELHYYPQQGNTSVLSEGACLTVSCWDWGWWLWVQGCRYSRQGRCLGPAGVGVSWEPWRWHAGGCKSQGAAAEGQMGLKILKNGGNSLLNRSFLHSGLLNQSWNPMEEWIISDNVN